MGAKEGALILDLIRNLKAAGEVSMIMIDTSIRRFLKSATT